jgi:hypothetical protein
MPHVVVVRIEANFVRNFLRQKSANGEATARDAPAHDKRVLTPDTVLRLCRNREAKCERGNRERRRSTKTNLGKVGWYIRRPTYVRRYIRRNERRYVCSNARTNVRTFVCTYIIWLKI